MKRGLALAVAVGLWAVPAKAVDVRISSETVGQGYQLITATGDVLKRSRLNQMLGLQVLDMTGDKTNLISFVTQLRFDSDFGLTGSELDAITQLKNNNLSILYAYFQVQGLLRRLDIRLGRQLQIDDFDFLMFDGLRLKYTSKQHFGLEVFSGAEVKNAGFLSVISDSQLESDGDGAGQLDERVGVVIGATLSLENFRDHHTRVGYRRIMDADGPVDQERIFLSTHHRIDLKNHAVPSLHLAASAAWDFVIGDVNDIRADLRLPGIADLLDVELSYLRLVPSFEGSSIFNVFNTMPLNDIDARLRFHIGQRATAYVGSYVRLFGNDKDADDQVEDDGVRDVGIRAGGRVRFDPAGWLELDASYQFGYGDMTVIDLGGGYAFLGRTLGLRGRLTTIVFEDAVQAKLNGTSFGAEVGLSYKVRDMAKFHLVGEVNTNKIESVAFRVFGLVELDFWL